VAVFAPEVTATEAVVQGISGEAIAGDQ